MNTIKQEFPIPHIQDMFNTLCEARIFTKLDIESAHHQIKTHPDDKLKTGFITQDGCFQWKVMPFGLKNAPFTLQRIIHKILKDAINIFVLAYIDDICIFSRTEEENLEYIKWALNRLSKAGLRINIDKCDFLKKEIKILGFTIGRGQIKITESHLNQTVNNKE